MKIYEKDYHVGPGETDLFDLCRPSSLLMFLQDAATTHGGIIGLERNELIKQYNAVWILARLWYQLKKPIRNGDTVHLKTWNRGLKGVMWYRDFSLSANGEEVGQAVNAWVLADVETHHVKRPGGLEALDPSSAISFNEYTRNLNKITTPDSLTPSFEKVIHYSDLDINVHLNNTKYADLCCDAVHYENMQGKFISNMQINYLQECRIGDCVMLHTADTDGGKFICGVNTNNAKNVFFESELSFSDC